MNNRFWSFLHVAIRCTCFLGVILSFHVSYSQSPPGIGMPYMFNTTTPVVATPSTGWTNIVVPVANRDDWTSAAYAPPGFSFRMEGVTYTSFHISTNGFIVLSNLAGGSAAPAYYAGGLPVNALASNAGGLPVIAPLWDDNNLTSWQYQTAGSILYIRFSNIKWGKLNGTAWNFMVLLNYSTQSITFCYPATVYVPNAPSASIGIAGACPGNFYSVYTQSSNTAFADSVNENPGIGTGLANCFTPRDVNFIFTPNGPYNDNCTGAYSLGSISAACAPSEFATVHAQASSSGNNCGTGDTKDVWFSFVKPAGMSSFDVKTSAGSCNSVSGTTVQVFSGTCAALTNLGCSTINFASSNSFGEVNIVRPPASLCIAETLYARVTGDADAEGTFNLCVQEAAGTAGTNCGNPQVICSLPYTRTGMTTTGYGNDYDSTASQCHSAFANGEDYIFSYTPPVNQCIRISLTNTGANPGLFIMDGCPNLGTTNCLVSVESSTNSATINSVSLIAGVTYYIMVDNSSTGGSIGFDISVTSLGTVQGNDACSNAVNLGSVSAGQVCTWSVDYSTECSTPSPSAGYPDPGCAGFQQGVGPVTLTGDVWFRFISNVTGNVLIDTKQGSVNPIFDGGMAIYTGTCGSFTLVGCDDNSGTGSNMPALSISAVSGVTYYVRVWAANSTNTGSFQICVSSNCSQPNDLPCNAIAIPLGSPTLGNNQCTGNTSEPPAPPCWVNGTINTVWYSAVVPASGKLNIKAAVFTNTNTQIAAYIFPTGCANAAISYNLLGCNDNTTGCPCTTPDYGSELKLTSLMPGTTVYIAVDGNQGLTGTFMITVVDGNNPYPPLYGQDCGAPLSVCSNALVVVNTPSTGVGNLCDPNGNLGGCFSCGERSGIWYTFTADAPLLQFTITPNAYTPTANFDFAIWNVTGQSNPCGYVAATVPVRCNNSGAVGSGATGLSSLGGTGFSTPITVTGPTTFVLAIRNWNHTPVGYTINWMGTNIVTPANPTLTWNGSVDTTFETGGNWNCYSPFVCANDVVIPFSAGIPYQPTISTNQNIHSLSILAGASLRIKTGVTLSLCGNLSNYGTLIMEPNSTILFTGAEIQTITGSLVGGNSFANLAVNKSAGSVTCNNNLDILESFSTQTLASVFNINGKYMRVGRDFSNFSGTATFTGYPTSTVEFNGNVNQYFTNQNGSITLNRVFMNKPSGKLYLTGANSSMNVDSILGMTNGWIVTRSSPNLEVFVKSNSAASIAGAGPLSFVDGKLRRKVYAGSPLTLPFSVNFPVGDSLKGYELANITYRTSTVVPDILCFFTSWAGPVPASGPVASECLIATYSTLPVFNHGYWTFYRPNNTNFNGSYKVTLYNNAFTNNAGMGWTVAYTDTASDPLNPASWGLIGKCVISSTAINTQRDSINVPASLTTTFNMRFATVQTGTPLPIELISFTAVPAGEGVMTKWTTASETNNEFFDVERSQDGEHFEFAGKVPGYGTGVSTIQRSYSLFDDHTCEGIVYYRLKQVDIDGMFTYSDVVAVNCLKNNKELVIYPNPVHSSFSLTFFENDKGPVWISIVDYTGRPVRKENLIASKGYNTLQIPVEDLSSGVYYLEVHYGEHMGDPGRQVRFVKY